jgi:4-carboxymuconolactone decarboxylase
MKPFALRLIVTLLLTGAPALAMAEDRMPPIPPAQYDEAQKKAAEEFLAARKTPVFGPFDVLMRSPEFMSTARAMGDYLRYKPAIGTVLSEFVILIVSREWAQDYEWYVHAPIAAKQGISKEIIDAIKEGRRPPGMSDDQAIVYDLVDELNRTHHVSDSTYDRAVKRFGEKGFIDITGIAGYYTLLAMTMNAARSPSAPDGSKLPRFPD